MNDSLIKQRIAADLDEYVLSQKKVAEILNMSNQGVSNLVRDRKLIPVYIFNQNDARKINLFYKKDIIDYQEKLTAFRELRNK
ncbi:DNA-binding protein [Listeria ilorinensis]|uniref:DNA-binding protein n=1 Tax=Listeria ilorinensis TaxID=2867439 RepID=UPI001EF58D82|nr:DNA-binding protein [Listeria ilorinensis]